MISNHQHDRAAAPTATAEPVERTAEPVERTAEPVERAPAAVAGVR